MGSPIQRKNSFKVKAKTQESYFDKLKEFTEMMDKWQSNQDARDYIIEPNQERLEFNIIAIEYGEN